MYRLIGFKAASLVAVIAAVICLAAFSPIAHAAASSPSGRSSSVNCVQPPNNVDPATFTDAQLDMYGLPHWRPGKSLSQWQWVVRAAKHRECSTRPMPTSSYWSPSPVTATSVEASKNWAGNIGINYGYQEAIGYWNVPCLQLLLKTGYSVAWVGLGGDGNDGGGNLLQAGSSSYEYKDFTGRWVAGYNMWYEDFPTQGGTQGNFGVSCGDSMYADIWQYSDSGAAANMFVEDLSTGEYLSSTNTHLTNHSTAEWIVERPGICSSCALPGLADFRWVAFTDCYALWNGSYTSLISLPHNFSRMRSNNGSTILASPGTIYADSGDSGAHFNVNWNSYGP